MKSGLYNDHSDIAPILDGSKMIFRLIKEDFPSELRSDIRSALEAQNSLYGRVIRALIEIRSVVVDLEMCYFMVRWYPWLNTPITRSKHLEITYFTFSNYCYIFKQKIKLLYNAYKYLRKKLHDEDQSWLKSILSRTDRKLGRHIRFRGETVHEWGDSHPDVHYYSILELIESVGDKPFDFDLDAHYRESRLLLSWEIRAGSREARHIYSNMLDVISPYLLDGLRQFSELCELVLSDHERANKVMTVGGKGGHK